MRTSLRIAGAAGLLMVFALNTSLQGQDDSGDRKIATAMAKKAAIAYFNERKFEFHGSTFQGEAKAASPQEHIQVSIREFHLLENRVLLSCTVDCRFEFSGELTKDEKTVKVKGEVDIAHSVSAAADFRMDNDKLVVRARVNRLDFEVKLRKLDPSDLAGGKQLIQSVLNNNKSKLMREMNDWLATHQLGREQSSGTHGRPMRSTGHHTAAQASSLAPLTQVSY